MFRTHTLIRIYQSTVAGILLLFGVAWMWIEQSDNSKALKHVLFDEDQVLEFMGVAVLAASLIVSVYALLRSRKSLRATLSWWILPLITFLLICEETSFGRIYYKWFTPPLFCNIKIDTFHDLLTATFRCVHYMKLSPWIITLITVILIGTILLALFFLYKTKKDTLIASIKTSPLWIYLGLAFVLFWMGGGIDIIGELHYIKVKNNNIFVAFEELFELLAAYSLFFATLVLYSQLRSPESQRVSQ